MSESKPSEDFDLTSARLYIKLLESALGAKLDAKAVEKGLGGTAKKAHVQGESDNGSIWDTRRRPADIALTLTDKKLEIGTYNMDLFDLLKAIAKLCK